MGAFSVQAYRLASGGVGCDDRGLLVGGIALVKRCANGVDFEPRGIGAINEDLSQRYGGSVDVATRASGFLFVASHLQKGERVLSQIGALLLRFPDPPRETSDIAESTEERRFALA